MDSNEKIKSFAANAICCVGMIFFIFAACYKINLPGVYYDEAIFAPVALKVIDNTNIQAAISFSVGPLPVLQSPFYVGALKAYFYMPIFWLFGVSPTTIRLPMLIVSALVLLGVFHFIKKRFGPLPSSAVFILMATDPVYIFHSRIDWGPFVFSNLFKLLAVGFCLKWHENGNARYLALTLISFLLGIYDKLNFIWIIISLGISFLLVYPVWIWRWLKNNRRLVMIYSVPFITICALIVAEIFLARSLNVGGAAPYDFFAQINKIYRLYIATFSGEAQFAWMFSRPLGVLPFLTYLIAPQLVFGMLFPLYMIFRRRPNTPSQLENHLFFFSILIVVLILEMIATKEVGGSHHLVMLWPFQYIHLVLCGLVILQRLQVKNGIAGFSRFATVFALVIILIVAQNVKGTFAYIGALDRNGRFSHRFDPVIYNLVGILKNSDCDQIVSVDWGIHQTVVSLALSSQRPKYLDWWPIFMDRPGLHAIRDRWLYDNYLKGKSIIFVTHMPEVATFPDTIKNFKKFLSYWHINPIKSQIIENNQGVPFYQIIRCDNHGSNGD